MQPIIGNGFGTVARVMGPWQDYVPAQLQQPDSQYGLCIGVEIQGGERGATISAITLEPPFNIAGNLLAQNWRCLVIRGHVPVDNMKPIQLSTKGWPRVDSALQLDIIWSKVIGKKITADTYNSGTEPETHFPFPDESGPSVGPGETMSVLYFAQFNDSGAPAYGAGNFTFASLSVFGTYSRGSHGSSDVDQSARSMPRGRLG